MSVPSPNESEKNAWPSAPISVEESTLEKSGLKRN